MDSLARVQPEDVVYEDLVAVAVDEDLVAVAVDDRFSRLLRDEQRCNLIVKLTQFAKPTVTAPFWSEMAWTSFSPGMTGMFRCGMWMGSVLLNRYRFQDVWSNWHWKRERR